MHLAELLGDATAPRLHFGTGGGWIGDLGWFAGFADGRLAGRGAVAGGGWFGFGGLGGEAAAVARNQDRCGGGDGLGDCLLFAGGQRILRTIEMGLIDKHRR